MAAPVNTENPSPAEVLLLEFRKHVLHFPGQKRRFDYNSIIVSMYGLFEQFIEAMARLYVDRLSNVVPSYAELPESITNNHVGLTFELVKNEKRLARMAVKKEVLISNLNACLNAGEAYNLNAEAFAHHTANFTPAVINDTFSRVGISNICALAYNFMSPEAMMTDNQRAFFIEDLAQRRNDVAHGVPSDVLSNPLLLDRIGYLHSFGNALYEIVYGESLSYEVQYYGIRLGAPIAVYGRSIVCLTLDNVEIGVGDFLISETSDPSRRFQGGEIDELQRDKVSYAKIEAAPRVEVGIRVSYRPKENHEFFLVRNRLKASTGSAIPLQLPLVFASEAEDEIRGDGDELD